VGLQARNVCRPSYRANRTGSATPNHRETVVYVMGIKGKIATGLGALALGVLGVAASVPAPTDKPITGAQTVAARAHRAVEYEAPEPKRHRHCGKLLAVVVKSNGVAVFRYERCDRKVKSVAATE
jgi:hypothetical protein